MAVLFGSLFRLLSSTQDNSPAPPMSAEPNLQSSNAAGLRNGQQNIFILSTHFRLRSLRVYGIVYAVNHFGLACQYMYGVFCQLD